ncbi:MAG: tyrosine--tRNA ligase [Myxococcota bacterium]
MHVLDELTARGFIEQASDLEALRARMDDGPIVFYTGFDPTADSLHVGHLVPVLMMAHLQRAGHVPIAVVGGGTGMVGDPSGKTEARQLLDEAAIDANLQAQKGQLQRFLTIDGSAGHMVNNGEWLLGLNYIAFLRDIGACFSVNRMLAAEGYKIRLERGLSFIEFNYQLLQAYDFLELNKRYGCQLQLGGNDQWGNILAGVDLVRRKAQTTVWGLTTPLLTTASGAKMGKTAGGAVWLSAERFKPFDFYQYWVNVDDADVGRFLKLFTFLDLATCEELGALQGADIRRAKARLAWEVTALVHGKDQADRARDGAKAMVAGAAAADLPTHTVSRAALEEGVPIYVALAEAKLTSSRSDARRMVKGGAVRMGQVKVHDAELRLTVENVPDDGLVLRVGKKRAVRLLVQD